MSLSPGARRRFGDGVIARVRKARQRALSRQLRSFEQLHAALARADDAVHAAEEELFSTLDRVGPLDVEQDRLVRELQVSLISDGFPQPNPFVLLGFKPAADIIRMPDEAEARLVMKLAAETLAARDARPVSKAIARALGKAAAAVLAGVASKTAAEEALRDAAKARERLFAPWDAALEALRTSLRLADFKAGTHLYEKVFGG